MYKSRSGLIEILGEGGANRLGQCRHMTVIRVVEADGDLGARLLECGDLRRREAEAFVPKRRRHVDSEIARVHEFVYALGRSDFIELGRLLKQSHESLRDDYEVSTATVDALVEKAWAVQGCVGARIMGAGFGGSILALVERGHEQALIEAVGRPVIICATADGAFVGSQPN